MRSVTSCFNPTLFRKNLARYWPIWGLYGVIWLFCLPIQLLSHPSAQTSQRLPLDFLEETALLIAVVFGVLAAMAVFSYLYSSRSAGMFHSLPVRREGLFLTNYLSGLCFFLIPNVVVFFLSLAAELSTGTLVFSSLFQWLLVNSLLCLFFYSFAVFCAMFTGHILALPAFYAILNGLVAGLVYTFNHLASSFLYGFTSAEALGEAALWLTPVLKLSSGMRVLYDQTLEGYLFSGLRYVLLYALIGLVLAALALLVYRRRQLESAGDTVSVRPVRPIFKYGAAACCAVILGIFLYDVIFYDLVPRSPWSLLLFMLLAGAVGYYLADMVLRKSFRVFRRNWKGCVILLACVAAFMCVLEFDVFGVERRVPDADRVASVHVSSTNSSPSDQMSYTGWTITDPDQIARVIRLHQAIVDNRAAYENRDLDTRYMEAESGLEIQTVATTNVWLRYTLTNGSMLTRDYYLSVSAEELDDPDSPGALLTQLINDRALVEDAYFGNLQEGSRLLDASVTVHNPAEDTWEELYADSACLDALLEAVLADIRAGDLGRRYLLDDEERLENCYYGDLVLTFSAPAEEEEPFSVSTESASGPYDRPAVSSTIRIRIGLQTSASRTLEVLAAATNDFEGLELCTHADTQRMSHGEESLKYLQELG